MNSTYIDKYHVAVPSLDLIKEMTGYDLITEGGWTKEVTEAKVLSYTLKARDYLFRNKAASYQIALPYMIKFKTNWNEAWTNYVIRYIESTFLYGNEQDWKEVPFEISNAINGSLLKNHNFSVSVLSEIENSSEEW